jgi:hypothetical protein
VAQDSPSARKKAMLHHGKCSSCKKESVMHYADAEYVLVKITRDEFLEGAIEFVTCNGRPSKIFSDSGMKKMVGPLMQAFKPPVSLHHEKLIALVENEAESVRKEIMELFGADLFSLKIDIVTRLDRGFLGINAQTCRDGKIVLRCLGCVILTEKHTSKYIVEEIKKVLAKFGFDLKQIFSITYDNGRNMVRAGEILSEDAKECLMEDLTASNLHDTESIEIDKHNKSLDDELKEALKTLAGLTAVMDDAPMGINDLRCVAHTLQLAVEDVLKLNSDIEYGEEASLIKKARDLVKLLRTPVMKHEIERYKVHKGKKLNLPRIDVVTRWMSSHDMLQSCLEYREFCNDPLYFENSEPSNTAFKLMESEHEELIELLAALKPLKISTLKFQSEQLTISCMTIAWESCKADLRTIGSNFSKQLLGAMKKREDKIFTTLAIQCALYLDPRLQVLIPDEIVPKVQEQLLFIGNRAQLLKLQSIKADQNKTPEISAQSQYSEQMSGNESNADEDDFEKRLNILKKKKQAIARVKNSKSHTHTFGSKEIEEAIQNFAFASSEFSIPLQTNILEFWESQKSNMPIMYHLAKIVLAAPPTQVSVERLFSGLRFILNPLRNAMKPETIDNIMLIKTNKIFAGKQPKNS